MKNTSEFNKRYQRWKAGELVYSAGKIVPEYAGGKDDDSEYYDYLGKLAEKKSRDWVQPPLKPDADLTMLNMMNDPTYDYRALYDHDRMNAMYSLYGGDHFTDVGKTWYHPTFSDESIYSGKISDRNPFGAKGGHWNGEYEYVLSPDQMMYGWNVPATLDYLKGTGVKLKEPKYGGGKDTDLPEPILRRLERMVFGNMPGAKYDKNGRYQGNVYLGTNKQGQFGGGHSGGSGYGYRLEKSPEFKDDVTFNEAYDSAHDAGFEFFKYGEKWYNTNEEHNPVRELNNRFVGGSTSRSKLKTTDSYQEQVGPFKLGGLESRGAAIVTKNAKRKR